jgi:peptidoglycan/LPS O-acetylase OafA/YrhL
MRNMQSQLTHPKYRHDIDGLRAIAVLAVVGFHAFPDWIGGGFVGVDIFFVISGFLISTIIYENLDRGTFSFLEFYIRRIRRIFPALIVVLIACIILGWFVLLAEEYKQLGKHMLASAGFVANIIFWNEAGYFDNAADTKPLLHLWSLGIEEQFYILWPLITWFAWIRKFNLLIIIIFLLLLSFGLNIFGLKHYPVAIFFSPLTRFWELFFGAFIAWITIYRSSLFKKFPFNINLFLNFCSAVGLILITYSFFVINKQYDFPGFWALVPILGAALIILSGNHTWLNSKILSNRVLVWFGLISFPLYLWHWPLLSFARIIESGLPHRNIRIAILLLSVLLAWLTYAYVEKLFRFGGAKFLKTSGLCVGMSLIACLGLYINHTDGLLFRQNIIFDKYYKGDIGHLEYHKYISKNFYTCLPQNLAVNSLKWEGFIRCNQSKNDLNVDIALVGDSHAEHLFLGMAEALPEKNVAFYIKDGLPLIDNPDFSDIYKSIKISRSIKIVVISAYWSDRISSGLNEASFDDKLLRVVDYLGKSGKNVYITDDVPNFPFDPINCKGKRWPHSPKKNTCTINIDVFNKQKSTYITYLEKIIEKRPDVKLINLGNNLCDSKFCSMTKGDKIFYRDKNHLNLNGSRYIGRIMVLENPSVFF